jgi:multicomponent Na+:H+ antiporter subunit B
MMGDLTQYFDYVLMAMLLAVGVAIIRLRNLFAIVMLTGVYSLLSAAWFTSLDALDVGFTEAAVGAGISTVLLLAAMLLTSRECDKVSASRHWAALAVCVAAGAALFYALPDMAPYGAADSPANAGVGMEYMDRTAEDLKKVPNVVTAVLGTYRGFDTMGEVFVVFAAGVGVALLMGLSGRRREEDE